MFKSRFVSRTALGVVQASFVGPFFRILGRLGPQHGPKLEAKTGPKSIKSDAKNGEILKAPWKVINSKNLRFWRPTWKQVGTKIEAEIDVIFERPFFEKTSFFLWKNTLF